MGYNDKYPDMSAMYAFQFEYENKLKDKIKELEAELERTRKVLEIAVDALNFYANKQHYKNEELDLYVYEYEDNNETGILDLDDGGQMENGKKARDALAEIKTALEQKE